MIKKIISLIFLSILLIFAKNVNAEPNSTTPAPMQEVSGKKVDQNSKILAAYLKKYNSPLQDYAHDFIEAAEKYGIDWKLVPSISGVESTFGKFIPGGTDYANTSYNAWGWGASTPEAAIYFKSWKEAIYTISKGLKENYIDKGLKDPVSMNRVYAASPTWGTKVAYFMKDLEGFAAKYTLENPEITSIETNTPVAATSGQLAFK